MGGLIFGKRTLCLKDSVYFIDDENYLFCEMSYGSVELQPGVKTRKDSV